MCFVDGMWYGKVMNGDYMDVDIFWMWSFLNGFRWRRFRVQGGQNEVYSNL